MNLKDYLRILRRWWLPFAIISVGGFALLCFLTRWESSFYAARARVVVEAPEAIRIAESPPPRLLPRPLGGAEWGGLITGPAVRDRLREHLPENVHARLDAGGWLPRVRAARHDGTGLITITAEGPDEASAVALANACAAAAEAVSREEADRDLVSSRECAAALVAEADARIDSLQADLDRRFPAEAGERPPEVEEHLVQEYHRTQEEFGGVERAIETNKEGIFRTRDRRAELAALQSESVPRVDPVVELLASTSPVILELRKRIDALTRKLLAARTKLAPTHPERNRLELEIRKAAAELTERTFRTAESNYDREELQLLMEGARLKIRRDLLDRHLTSLRESIDEIRPSAGECRRLQKSLHEERSRRGQIASRLEQLKNVDDPGAYVHVLKDEAARDGQPMQPFTNRIQFILLLAVPAILIGAAGILLLERLDPKLRTEHDVERKLNLPVLCVVPHLAPQEEKLLSQEEAGTALSEAFDTLATLVGSQAGDEMIRALTVASSKPGEGRSTACVNIAIAAGRQGRQVLLIDADLRTPRIHEMLGLSNEIGFSNLLLGGVTDEEWANLYQYPGIENLTVITSGPASANPATLLESTKVRPLLALLQEHFDLVIFDTPPLLRTGDAVKLATVSDAALIVVGAEKTDQREAVWSKHMLENARARILGALLNGAKGNGLQAYRVPGGFYETEAVDT